MNMTEDLREEKRVWYLKGYEQAERLALIDDVGLFGKPQETELKLNTEIDALKDLLKTAYGIIDSDYDGTEEHLVLRREIEAVLDKAYGVSDEE